MEKKGDAELIAVVLLIMIVIMVISAFAFFYFRYLERYSDKVTKQNMLNNADITIKDMTFKDTQNLSVTFFSGPGFQMLINYSVEEVNYTYVNITTILNTTSYNVTNGSFANVSVVSVADVSGSMQQDNKIVELKAATVPFVNAVLNNTGNKIGFAAYSTSILEEHCHVLSNDNNSLILTVNGWTPHVSTCVCCGINKAIEYLEDAEGYKVMILMSDGMANINDDPWTGEDYCPLNAPELSGPVPVNAWCSANPNDPCDDAIYLAERAFNDYNITVHTIGFGEVGDIDEGTLQRIAAAGNGSYYYADISELEEIYSNLSEQLIIYTEVNQTVYNYTTETIYQNITTVVYVPKENFYLKIVFYTEDFTYIQNKNLSDLPGPAEEKEVTLSLDPLWGITTDDLTKIKIYTATIEEGIEMISEEPIAVWEKPGLYHIR